MNTTDFLQAVAAPLRYPVLLIALVVFWVPGAFGLLIYDAMLNIMPFVGGLALIMTMAFMVPALTGYLLQLVDTASRHLKPPVADTELFLMIGSDWRVFPLFLPAALLLLFNTMAAWSAPAAFIAVGILAVVLLPLHLMLLAVTNSRPESVNPLAMIRLLTRLWPCYLWLLPAFLMAVLAAGIAWYVNFPSYLKLAIIVYLLMFLAMLCGRLLTVVDVAGEIDIGEPLAKTDAQIGAATLAERNRVLSHAYGLISRGNPDGGFAHIDKHVEQAGDDAQTAMWFFFAMQDWDLGDEPLFYGQQLISRLLAEGDGAAAMKVLSSCLYRNESFRPRPGDRDELRQVADALGNEEIRAALRRMP